MEIEKCSATDTINYQKAKKKVRGMREFYINLLLFCVAMPIIIGCNLYFVPEYHWFWFSLMGWGSGLLFHGLSAFEINPLLRNNWEQRKIQEFLKESKERESKNNNFK